MGDLGISQVCESGRAIPNISEARQQPDRASMIANWVVANVPWTIAVPDWPDFHDRWPLLSRAELAAVEEELRHRAEALEGPDANLDKLAGSLVGRRHYWTAAADWLTLNPRGTITDPEFVHMFRQLSRAELILAAIEHKRRLLTRV